MISWWWLIPAAVVGGGLGILALAICMAGSSADDWSDGYWQGRKEAKLGEGGANGVS
jgi:hypothetical protein